jgi:hypothetical protein
VNTQNVLVQSRKNSQNVSLTADRFIEDTYIDYYWLAKAVCVDAAMFEIIL